MLLFLSFRCAIVLLCRFDHYEQCTQIITQMPYFVHSKILNALLAKYERFSFRDENQETPLHLAASGGIVENVAALVQLSAGLNERDDQGRAPLHKAVANGHR